MKSAFHRFIAILMTTALLAPVLPAQALGRDAPADPVRRRVETLLVAHGVDAREAHARASALTEEEAARVAAEFDRLPAGGNPAVLGMMVGLAVWVVAAAVTGVVYLVGAIVNEARK